MKAAKVKTTAKAKTKAAAKLAAGTKVKSGTKARSKAKAGTKAKPGPAPVPAAAPTPGPTPGPAPVDGAQGAAAAILDTLWRTVLARRSADPATSHSARLLSRGTAKVAQKFGEEAVECLIEAVAKNPAALVLESADVLYHLVVMWVAAGVEPAEVWAELERRQGMSGIAEKAARGAAKPSVKVP